jgi:hypothetical protein
MRHLTLDGDELPRGKGGDPAMALKSHSALCATLAMLFCCVGTREQKTLAVEGPRPVADAISALEQQYGVLVSYEDARYVNSGDVADVTDQVARDLDKYPPGQGPRILAPRTHRLAIQYSVDANGKPQDVPSILQAIIDAEAKVGTVFELRDLNGSYAVVPKRTRGLDGMLHDETPVLDARIDLPDVDRSAAELLEAICSAVSKVTSMQVENGMVPMNFFLQTRVRRGASNDVARDVLRSSFLQIGGSRLVWSLLYDPGDKAYALNVHFVPDRTTQAKEYELAKPRLRREQSPFVRPKARQGADGG